MELGSARTVRDEGAPRRAAWPFSRAIHTLGYAAVWTGLYVAASVLLAIHTSTHRLPTETWLAILAAYLCGQSVYLLDRAKLRDAWLDEADRQAHPQRFGFIHRHRRRLRALIVIEGLAAAGLLWLLHPVLALLVPAAYVGVVVYAGLPRTSWVPPGARRIKDLLIVKNLAVAGSITAFAMLLALVVAGDEAGRFAWWRWSWPAAFLLLHVLADSMLCDIDDIDADRRFGTQTLAWRRSAQFVRSFAIVLAFAVAIATLMFLWLFFEELGAKTLGTRRVIWAFAMAATSIALAFVPIGSLRDAVDSRLQIVALFVILVAP